jgi:transposase
VNTHDSVLFPDSFHKLIDTANRLGIPLKGIPLTLDSGFDSEKNSALIREAGMVSVIKPNFRNTKDKKIIRKRKCQFQKLEDIYKKRHTIERSFAWEDKYRKLVIRYERLQATFNGFRYLAGAMINYRTEFGKNPL